MGGGQGNGRGVGLGVLTVKEAGQEEGCVPSFHGKLTSQSQNFPLRLFYATSASGGSRAQMAFVPRGFLNNPAAAIFTAATQWVHCLWSITKE